MSFEPGTVIAGKYRVERVIGQGGMGVVLAARHLGLDEMVAVKLIREERAEGVGALARFQREARAAARIKSEHVARVLDVDRLPEGAPYIVMELIDGTDLHALVKRNGALPPDEAVTYIIQACEGLAEAHALGMVHRDLKLKNLFLTRRRDGRALIKVIDFGVVKFSRIGDDDPTVRGSTSQLSRAQAREATLTNAAMLVGSVHYMAPEQIRASNVVDAQADVWSLGVCLYTMLTGTLPFDGETVEAVCTSIQGRPPRNVCELAPGVPPELADAVMRALEKDVRRRFVNVADFAAAMAPHGLDPAAPTRIEAILQSNGGQLALPPSRSSEPMVGSTLPSDEALRGRVESTIDAAAIGSVALYPSFAHRPTKRGRWIGAAIVTLAAVGATGVLWGQRAPMIPRTSSNHVAGAGTGSVADVGADADAAADADVAVGASTGRGADAAPNASAPSVATAAPAMNGGPLTIATAVGPRTKPALRPSKPRPLTTTAATTAAATTSAAATPAPMTEPSSAYDHF